MSQNNQGNKALNTGQDPSIPSLDGPTFQPALTEHEKEWVEGSGVSLEITQSAIESLENDAQIANFVGWDSYYNGPGYVIRGVDPATGKTTDIGGQFKPNKPIPERGKDDKKKKRYLCRKDGKGSKIQPLFLGIPSQSDYWHQVLKTCELVDESHQANLVITEGAKKAGAVLTDGLPGIALQGVWNWREKDGSTEKTDLKEWLKPFCKTGVRVFLAFDRDQVTNQNVRRALNEFASALQKRGCEVFSMSWDDKLKGIDDYYVVNGEGAIRALIATAKPIDLKPKTAKKTQRSKASQIVPAQKANDLPLEGCYFESTHEGGLEWVKVNGENLTRKDVSGHIEAIGSVEHENEGKGILVRFLDRYKNEQTHFISYGILMGDGPEAYRDLAKKGLWINPRNKSLLLEYLMSLNGDPSQCVQIVTRCGWHGDSFVVPDRTYGNPLVRFQDIDPPKNPKQAINGSLDDWKQNIGRYCQGNPRLIFFVLVAIAPPMSNVLNAENGGYHLFGESSKGKTTALKIAASVYGLPKNINKSWHSTNVGLELMAAEHNDQCLFLDEIGQADPKVIASSSYFLANGQGKQRGNKNITLKPSERYSIMILSTGEHPSTDYISESGRNAKSGQEVRLVDVPVDSQSGMGVFDNLHDFKNPGELADYLNTECSKYHGSVFAEFMERLVKDIENPDKLGDWQLWMHTGRIQIAGHWWNQDCAPMIKRILSRLAMVYAVGIQAVKYGVLPFSEEDVLKSCSSVFESFMEHRGSGASRELIQGIEAVEIFIKRNVDSSRFIDIGKLKNDSLYTPPSNPLGYIDKSSAPEQTEIWIDPAVFRDEFGEFGEKALKEELNKRGWLKTSHQPERQINYTSRRTIAKGDKRRFLVFNPFWLDSSE